MRSVTSWAMLWAGVLWAQTMPPAFTVSTVAGDASIGDGGPAVNALLDAPWGLAVDAQGTVYICDWYHERVRKVLADGTIQWAAGAPSVRTPPYNLSEGPADRVFINYPQFITVAPDGTVWFTNTYRIYRLNPDGTLTWVAGRNSTSSSSADGTAAKEANLANIRGLAVNQAGLVYFFESGKNTVRRVNAEGKIETVAGTGKSTTAGDGGPASAASFSNVNDIEFDASGNLFVADSGTVRKIDGAGVITRFAGDPDSSSTTGPLTSIRLRPQRLAFDPAGNLYVLESVTIRKIARDGQVTTIAGSGKFTDPYVAENALAMTVVANDIAADAQGNVYYSMSMFMPQVLKVTPQGKLQVFAGTEQYRGDGGPAKDAWMHGPESLVNDGQGGYAFADLSNVRYRHVNAQGVVRTLAGRGNPNKSNPAIAFDPKAPAASAYLSEMGPLAADRAGGYAIFAKNQIFRVTATGALQALAGIATTSYTSPKEGEVAAQQPVQPVTGMAFDQAGRLVFGEPGALWRIEANGRLARIAGTGVSGVSGEKGVARELKIGRPTALAFAGDTLYFMDGGYVKKLTADGTIEAIAGGGTSTRWYNNELVAAGTANLSGTMALAVTPDGVLYGAHGNHYVYRLRPDGMIEKVAGTGDGAWAGDGGPALVASFKLPAGLIADEQGALYVADRNNNVIRKLTPLTAAALRKASGDEQRATVGQMFEKPLEVEVLSESGIPVSMVALEVKVVQGGVTVEKGTSATGANGRLSMKVTAKEAGPVVIEVGTAALGVVQFLLTVEPDVPVPPVLAARAGAIAPGMLVALRGEKMAAKTAAVTDAELVDGKLPTVFEGVCVTFGEARAAIVAVSPTAVLVQAPVELTPGTVAVRATAQCGAEAPLGGAAVEMQVAGTAPEFLYASKGEQNMVWTERGADGAIRVFLTGIGLPEPAPANGAIPAEPLAVTPPVTVWLQGRELTPEQVKLAAWAPRAEGWPALRMRELFGELALITPGLGYIEILAPADLGDAPWAITVKSGDVFTGENSWLAPPAAP